MNTISDTRHEFLDILNGEYNELLKLKRIYENKYIDLNLNNYNSNDTRRFAFDKIFTCLRNTLYTYNYLKNDFTNSKRHFELHNSIFNQHENNEELEKISIQYYSYNKLSFQLLMFSALESSLRSIYTKLQLGKPDESFQRVYSAIFKKLFFPQKEIMKFSSCLDLLRHIRNALHNNGVFISSKKDKEVIVYQDNTYEFIQGEAISFVTMGLLIDLYKKVLQMLTLIYRHEEIKNIDKLVDPFKDSYDKKLNEYNMNTRDEY